MALTKITGEGVGAIDSLTVNRATSHGDIVEVQKDGTRFGALGSQSSGFYIDGESGHEGIRFANGAITPRENGSDSDNASDLGASNNRFKDLYLGGNLYIGGTGSANALSDYEEGTWTPTFFGSSTAGTYTYTTSGNSPYANYTKIGRTVTLQVMLNNITESSAGSGDVFVGGLPFDKVAGSAPFGCVHLNNWNTTGTITGVTVHPTTFANSGDKLQFTLDFDNTASNSLSLSHLKSGSSDVGFSLTYLTA
jgi:hypothetical protein